METCGRAMPVLLLVSLVSLSYAPGSAAVGTFKIGAFNVQILGQTKVSKPQVLEDLAQVVRRYDIVLIQEIRDIQQTAIVTVLNKVNEGPDEYGYIQSDRLGRSSSKEQYAFFYKLNAGITAVASYQYPDVSDVFEREPYSVLFTSANTAIDAFVLTAVHVKPTDAQAEINALDEVHVDVLNQFGNENILILGDLNADCSYLSNAKYDDLDMMTDHQFHWLVPKDWDTTISNSDCAYDRFVMTGDAFINAVQYGSVKVDDFETDLGISHQRALDVSDHYPIELTLVNKYGYL